MTGVGGREQSLTNLPLVRATHQKSNAYTCASPSKIRATLPGQGEPQLREQRAGEEHTGANND